MSLPRELQLIIDDIASQNVHLLEWEVFGNAEEDMRIVLTWRYSDAKKNTKQVLSRRDSIGKWKLRRSSITLDDPNHRPLVKDSDQNEKQNTQSKSEKSSENSKQKKLTHSEFTTIEGESEKVNSKDADEKKVKKKNPFRKVKKDEKAPKKGKLQLNLSMDGDDEHVGDNQLVVKRRSDSKLSKNGSNRNSLLDERILEQAEEYNKEQQKLEEERRKLDEEELQKKLEKESAIQNDKKERQAYDGNQEYKLTGKDVTDDKDEKDKQEYKKSGQDRRGSISAKQKRRGSKFEELKKRASFSGSIDENFSEKCAGYNDDQEYSKRKVKSESVASKVENHRNSTDDKISNQYGNSKEIAQLDDDTAIQRQRQDCYSDNQEHSKRQGSLARDEKIISDNKSLEEREGYDENQQYKEKTSENEIETTKREKALNGDKNKKKSDLLKKAKNVAKLDDNDSTIHRKKRPGYDDNEQYSRPRGSDGIEHGDSIDKGNCDQLKKEHDEHLRKEMIEKSRQEIAELQEIGETQEIIEFKNIKSEKAAQKMLMLQREKYCMSINETALDSLKSNFAPPSMSNETLDQNNEEKKSQDQIKPVSDDVNSSISKRVNAGDCVNQKNLKNEEIRRKSLKKQKQIKLHENKDSISREDFPSMAELPTANEIIGKSGKIRKQPPEVFFKKRYS